MLGRFRRAILGSNLGALQLEIASASDLNACDEHTMTPLLYAVYQGNIEAARLLLEAGADPNFNPSPSDPTHTPLWHAENDFGLSEIAALLRSHRAEK